MQGLWPTLLGHSPYHFLTMVGAFGVYLSTKGTSMSAKYASNASLLHNAPSRLKLARGQCALGLGSPRNLRAATSNLYHALRWIRDSSW